MPFCASCGSETAPAEKFCRKCGRPVTATAAPAPVTATAPAPVAAAPVAAAPVAPVASAPPVSPYVPGAAYAPAPTPTVSEADRAVRAAGIGLAVVAVVGLLLGLLGGNPPGGANTQDFFKLAKQAQQQGR